MDGSFKTTFMKLLFCITAAILSIASKAQQLRPDSVDHIIKKILPENSPACAVLIMKDGKILFKKAYGYEDVEKKKKATTSTQFNLGSLSKAVTAVAIMKLQEQGKLNVQDSVGKFFTGIKAGSKITIHHLLSHTSGLSDSIYTKHYYESAGIDWLSFDSILKQTKVKPLRQMYAVYALAGYSRKYEYDPEEMNKLAILTSEPGTKYNYSNSGYARLATIIEKAAGKNFNDYLREQIFLPLQMKHSYSYNFYNEDDIKQPAHTHFEMNDGSIRKIFKLVPDGEGTTNIYTSIDDWVQFESLLSGKRTDVLTIKSVAQLYSKHAVVIEREQLTNHYGYGWFNILQKKPGDTVNYIQHGGSTLGTTSFRRYYPKQDLVTVIFYAGMYEDLMKFSRQSELHDAIYSYLHRINFTSTPYY